jgi:hypothetical protein
MVSELQSLAVKLAYRSDLFPERKCVQSWELAHVCKDFIQTAECRAHNEKAEKERGGGH